VTEFCTAMTIYRGAGIVQGQAKEPGNSAGIAELHDVGEHKAVILLCVSSA